MTNALPRELASVVVVGAANVDTTYFVDGMPLAGETVLASRTMSGPGGKGANQAAGLAEVPHVKMLAKVECVPQLVLLAKRWQ
jgi:ribokinase